MTGPASTPTAEWQRYWPLVIAAGFGFSFHSVMSVFTGLVIAPLGDEFGWSRTELTGGLSLASILITLLSPLAGVAIDRWGTRRLALPGLLLKSLVIAGFGLISGSLTQWLFMWILFAITSLAVKSTVWTAAVSGVFDKSRGLAIGTVMAGTALAQVIVPPLGNWLIGEFGWRAAFIAMGLGWGGVALLLCLFFLYDAHDELRQARAASPSAGGRDTLRLPGLTVPEALRSAALWRIGISTLVMMTVTIALVVHQIPILEEAGVSRSQAAWLASLGGIAGIAGKLVTGMLLDRFPPNYVGGLTLASAAIAFALLMEPLRTPLLIVVAMVINGYASGTKLQVCGYLTSRYAGMKNFGVIFSVMGGLIALGSGLGPVLGGLFYDLHGDYSMFLLVGIVGSLLSGLLIFGLERYPDWQQDAAPAPAA